MTRRTHRLLLAAFVLGFFWQSVAAAPQSGNLSGLLLNESGQPLSDLVISLLNASSSSLPTLARTNNQGRVFLKDLEAGTYQLMVKSARYRSPERRLIDILPDRTAVVTLVLQQVFGIEEGFEDNLGVKALFRGSEARRLVFRHDQQIDEILGLEGEGPKILDNAVFEVYTNAGLGSNYFVFPGDSSGGTTTNFAVVDSMGPNSEYVFAGQMNSGEDSIWRLKNVIRHGLNENHSLKLFMGYGRISFEQPSLALLDDPRSLRDETGYATAPGTSHLLNVGFEDRLSLGRALTFNWGLEVDQFRGSHTKTFLSPSARLALRPLEKTTLQVSMDSKRPSVGNTLNLPEGDQVSLASPLYLARVQDELGYGTARHYQASVSQFLGSQSEIELAFFRDDLYGGAVPIVAIYEMDPRVDVMQLADHDAVSKGCRVTFRRAFSPNVKAAVSYIRAEAPGIGEASEVQDDGLLLIPGLVSRRQFNEIATQFDAYIPLSQTQITALVKFIPDAVPLMTLDVMSDIHETGNQGINFFVRQVLPVPEDLLAFLGLQFLAPERIEALLDVRNLLNEDIGTIQSADGQVTLVQNLRSVRGGLSFRF